MLLIVNSILFDIFLFVFGYHIPIIISEVKILIRYKFKIYWKRGFNSTELIGGMSSYIMSPILLDGGWLDISRSRLRTLFPYIINNRLVLRWSRSYYDLKYIIRVEKDPNIYTHKEMMVIEDNRNRLLKKIEQNKRLYLTK